MNVHFPLLLLLGCIVALWLRRYMSKSRRTQLDDPSLRPLVNWEITYRFLPVPQCDLKIDDAPLLSWMMSRIAGVDKHQQDNSLPDARNHNRLRRAAARETRSSWIPRFRSYSYDYLSPTLSVLGMLCAIALLIYQAGWTVGAISSRIRDGAERSIVSYQSTIPASQLHPGTLDAQVPGGYRSRLNVTSFASRSFKRSITEEPFVDAVELEPTYLYDVSDYTGSMLQLLIPGITVPLSHTFPLLLALLLSQVIHEAGHLVAAALHNILPIRITIGMWAIFPFAAVILPSSVNQLPPKPLLRIAAAGPFHNLLTYLTILLMPLGGMQYVFYQDVSPQGVFIAQIHDASPLKSHLPEGVIVHHLDDVPLGKAFQKAIPLVSPADMWTTYLLRDHEGLIDGDTKSELEGWSVNRGWCITDGAWKDSPQPPCPPSTGIRFNRVEDFTSRNILSGRNDTAVIEHRCFSAYPILTSPTVDCSQCTVSNDTSDVCVRPLSEERTLRIRYTSTGNGIGQIGDREDEQVLLYAGDPETVYTDVGIESLTPRGGHTVMWLVTWAEVVMMYVGTLSLALATLNLLPLPQLDGTHILSALLGLAFGSSDNNQGGDEYDRLEADDMELDDGMTSLARHRIVNARDRKRRWQQIITWTTGGLAAACVGGGFVLGLL